MSRATAATSQGKGKSKGGKPQRTMKVHVLNKDGSPAKNKDGSDKVLEAIEYDLDHPDCPPEIADDIHELFRTKPGSEIKAFLKMRPNFKKAVRQSSLRLRRHVDWALNRISRVDNWFLCRPIGGGELYWGVTRLGVPIILGSVGARVKIPLPFLRG